MVEMALTGLQLKYGTDWPAITLLQLKLHPQLQLELRTLEFSIADNIHAHNHTTILMDLVKICAENITARALRGFQERTALTLYKTLEHHWELDIIYRNISVC